MSKGKILVSGAGIAGCAVAYWLHRYGFEVTVVERAAALRSGGQAVDFRGEQQLHVLQQMGVLEAIKQNQTKRGGALSFVDANGKTVARLSAEFAGGELEIPRGELCRILYDATLPHVRYVFQDSIASIVGPQVTFGSGAKEDFDVIIGADGLHSKVRELVFGAEAQFVKHQDYFVCFFAADEALSLQEPVPNDVCFNEPGRAAVFGAGRVAFFFASPPVDLDKHDVNAQKELVERVFASSDWHVPTLLEHLRRATEVYFDSISIVRMPSWSRGRVVLLGDAGYGGTIGGMGSGMAIIGAYVLAGELSTAASPELAFQRYEAVLRDYARECQQGAADVGSFMAPKTRWGLLVRNLAFRAFDAVPGKGLMERLLMKRASGITLPRYV